MNHELKIDVAKQSSPQKAIARAFRIYNIRAIREIRVPKKQLVCDTWKQEKNYQSKNIYYENV